MKIKRLLSFTVFTSTLLLSLTLHTINYRHYDDPSVKHSVTAFLREDLENRQDFVNRLKNHPHVTTPSEFIVVHKITRTISRI